MAPPPQLNGKGPERAQEQQETSDRLRDPVFQCKTPPVFTGLVQCVGTIARRVDGDRACSFRIQSELEASHLTLGASVAVDGVCLTVTLAEAGAFEVTAAFETLSLTVLGQRQTGDRVNLEPSLRLGDPMGGHLVTGHVDGLGCVRSIEARGDARQFFIDAPAPLRRFIARKGSITVNGVSLTVNDVDAEGFTVGLIPHTLEVTTLGGLRVGDNVNLEVDLVARYLARLVDAQREVEGNTG